MRCQRLTIDFVPRYYLFLSKICSLLKFLRMWKSANDYIALFETWGQQLNLTKDTPISGQSDDLTTDEIARTVKLATQACDGFELSNKDLEALCDSLLCKGVTPS